MGYIITVCW